MQLKINLFYPGLGDNDWNKLTDASTGKEWASINYWVYFFHDG